MCREIGRVGTIRLAFEAARETNPSATLLLNDFDMSTAYECLIEGCLEAGIHVDALGLQSHMHQGYWGEQKTLAILDRFARYGLPIHFTESTLLSGELMPPDIEDLSDYQVEGWPSTPEGEARQADEVVRHYRTLLSHPAVEAITYWELSDTGAWLGAPVGFVRNGRLPQARVPSVARPRQGRVVARSDHAHHRPRGPRGRERLPGRVRRERRGRVRDVRAPGARGDDARRRAR